MMKKTIFAVALVIMLLAANWTSAGVSMVMNGTFEDDGRISNIAEQAPHHWCNVSLPSGKFYGWVSDDKDWAIHGDYYLTVGSYYYVRFYPGDVGTVSQDVYLTDVNEIIFDLKLDTTRDHPWDPNRRTAVLLIDGDVVWESNSIGPDVRGEYFEQTCIVDGKYKDGNAHTLSLGLRANVEESFSKVDYRTKWDFVKFDAHCGGFGYLPEDFSHDCYVDALDLAMLAEHWLTKEPDSEYDLFQNGVVDFLDFTMFAGIWLHHRDWRNWQDDTFLKLALLAEDLNDDGIVNLRDFTILAGEWLSNGDCIRADIDRSGTVDYGDVSELANEWLNRSWLYGL